MTVLDTGALTDLLLEHVQTAFGAASTDPLVGDATAPAAGGWVQGQPGKSAFRPYTVIVFTGAVPRGADIKHSYPTTWACGYSLRYIGGDRKQVDWMARKARAAFSGLKRAQVDTEWTVTNLEWVRKGPVLPNRAINPPAFQMADEVVLVAGS